MTYFLGLMAGLIAAVTGWLLSFSDDYGIEPLNQHKYIRDCHFGDDVICYHLSD